MNPDFWLERWTQGQIGFHQPEANPYLQKYWPELALPRGATVFVPLCGKTLDMRWLHDQGHRVLGLEISRKAVGDFFDDWGVEARIAQQGPYERWEARGITVLCGDFFDLREQDLGDVDAVFDRAALIALPATMRTAYARKLYDTLPARVLMLLITLDYEQAQMAGPPFAVSDREVHTLYADASSVRRLAALEVSDAPEYARFRERGATRLVERVHLIEKSTTR